MPEHLKQSVSLKTLMIPKVSRRNEMITRINEVKSLKRKLNVCLGIMFVGACWFGFSVAMMIVTYNN